MQVSIEAEKPARIGLQELAGEADVVFYSKSWAQVSLGLYTWRFLLNPQGQGYQSAEECLRKQGEMVNRAYAVCVYPLDDTS